MSSINSFFRRFIPFAICCFSSMLNTGLAQADRKTPDPTDISLAAQRTPILSAQEIADRWKAVPAGLRAGFAGSETRISRDVPPPEPLKNVWKAVCWKGEKIHTQVAIWSKDFPGDLTVKVSDLRSVSGASIPASAITTGFLGYVMTDEFRDGCGYRKPQDFDSSLVADLIDTRSSQIKQHPRTTQPVWVSVQVPVDVAAGEYNGFIVVASGPGTGNKSKNVTEKRLSITVSVSDRVLPAPSQWKYQLDLWQHPAAIARVEKVKLWSREHFDAMRPYYTMLAKAGQKCITASVVNEPWGHQTFDDYPGLIKWTKKSPGTWTFDYSLFDKYVEFVMSCGINGRINCYSMVPWKIAFTYFDEASGKEMVFTEAIGTPAYNAFWTPMLNDFASHLKEKGWFGKTAIAMDERPMAAMQSVTSLLKSLDPEWKISLAGEYHAEIEKDIYDYCVASKWTFPADVLERRKKEGKFSTWYTCCSEKYPNGFSFSPPDEHVWMGWYTAATGMDGYLRWAFNSWVEKPFDDSRFRTWPAGDTYQVYPGALSSIRFEKMIEGVQDFEKIRLLREALTLKGDSVSLAKLDKALQQFQISRLSEKLASDMVRAGKEVLAELSK